MAGARSDLTLRPLTEADPRELKRILATPEVARVWDDGAPWEGDPDSTQLTIEVGGIVAGLIQDGEELTPKYRARRRPLLPARSTLEPIRKCSRVHRRQTEHPPLNLLHQARVRGEADRNDEERGREFFDDRGYWPDEKPRV